MASLTATRGLVPVLPYAPARARMSVGFPAQITPLVKPQPQFQAGRRFDLRGSQLTAFAGRRTENERSQLKRVRNKEDRTQAFKDFRAVATVVSALFAGLAVYLKYSDSELLYDFDITGDAVSIIAGLLFAVSFQYSSPLQLLLVFFGKFETERPVDWVAARIAGVEDPKASTEYNAPAYAQALSAALIGAMGLTAATSLSRLGDTWSLSTAVGTAFLSFLYEVGRPRRLSSEEVVAREEQWNDFRQFAEARLVKAGSCHESEIFDAFVASFPQYRDKTEGKAAFKQLRRFVTQWNPTAERTPYGFYKNVALSSTFEKGKTSTLGS